MAARRCRTAYWLALGGAMAAHALLLSLPWPALPSHRAGTNTLAIELPPGPGDRAPEHRTAPQPPAAKMPASVPRRRIKPVHRPTPASPVNKPPVETSAHSRAALESKAGRRAPVKHARTRPSNGPSSVPKAHHPLAQVKPVRLSSTKPEPAASRPPSLSVPSAPTHRPRPSTDETRPGRPGAKRQRQRYQERLVAYLARFRHYPLLAQREGQEGRVAVHFVMDRQGRILSDHLVSRTPYPLLNREALAMLRRAQPLPPPPSGLAGKTLAWTLPIQFKLP